MEHTDKAVQAILDVVEVVQDNVPDGREKSLAIAKLQEAALWISFEKVLKR